MTSGLRGLLNASFEVVARLARDGHRVTYACPHDVGDLVRAQGIDYVQLPPANFDPAPKPPGGRLLSRFTGRATAAARRQAGIDALGMTAFRTEIEALAPDLVLIDTEMYEHIFTLSAMEVPVLGLTPFFAQWPDRGLPPLAMSATPDDTDAIARYRKERAAQIEAISRRHEYTERRSVLLAYAESLGYPTQALEQAGALTLFVDTQLPTLLLTARELDFAHEPPANAHYVGPMVATDRVEDASDADAQRLEVVLGSERSGPLLYCPLTTMAVSDDGFAQRLIEAIATRPEWTLLLAGAKGLSPGAPNVHSFGYLPQTRVLPHADLCITMAGMNTVHESLLAGIRLLAYPANHDQPGVASRLLAGGVAHVGDPEAPPAAIVEQIDHALGDPALGSKAAAMPASLGRYRDEAVLERTVRAALD